MSGEAFAWFLAGLLLGAILVDGLEPGFVPFSRLRYHVFMENNYNDSVNR